MSTFVGLALLALGVLLVVAGVRNRGAQLFSTVTGAPVLGTTVEGAALLPAPSTGPATPGVMTA